MNPSPVAERLSLQCNAQKRSATGTTAFMCGRYSLAAASPDDLALRFDAEGASLAILPPRLPSYNVAPGQVLPVVTRNSPNRLVPMKWGLVPSWAGDPKIGYRMINARGETVGEKPSFRKAFRQRRCLVPTSGYYEWKSDAGSRKKQPFYYSMQGRLFAFAGLWEEWHGTDTEGNALDLTTFTIITTTPNFLAAQVHDRMPVILPDKEAEKKWLDPATSMEELGALLVPFGSDDLTAHPVSTQINSVANNGEALIAPMDSL